MGLYTIPGLRVQRISYKARDTEEMEELLRRVQAYITITRSLGHPGLPIILNYEDAESELYVGWGVLTGVPLGEKYWRTGKRISLPEIRDCLRQIVDPMTRMHEIGLAIRNIQPALILTDQQGDSTQERTVQQTEYKLNVWNFPTVSGETFNINYHCRAPEQFTTCWGQPGPPADVYALAMTFYILLTGHGPFDKTETMPTQIRRQHLHETPALRGLPSVLRPVFLHALSKDPRDRPTIREFHHEFEQAYPRVIIPHSGPNPIEDIMTRVVSRRKALILLTLVIALIATVSVDIIQSKLSDLSRLKSRSASSKADEGTTIGTTLLTFMGHLATVNAAMPSPDGKLALSADQSGRLMVWDINSGNVLLDDNRRHEGEPIVSVAWAKNGQAFASLDVNGTVWLWRLQDAEYRPLASHRLTTPTNAVAWSPVGNHLVVASRNQVAVYDYTPGTPFGMPDASYTGHRDIVNSVVISQDGAIAASGSNDTTVQVWYVETAQQRGIYRGHTAEVSTVAISPDGQYIASGGVDQTVQIWDAQDHFGGVQFASRQQGPVCSMAWSPDGQYIAAGGDGKVICVYDFDGSMRYTYYKHKASIASVAWLPDERRIISAAGSEVHIWRAP